MVVAHRAVSTRRVADKIAIPYYVVNLKDYFNEKVINYFVKEYISGKTPNPCIACNKYLKFEELLKKALEIDAFYLATGHYAKVEHDPATKRYVLKKSVDNDKDQSYALYNLTQFQLEHILFPLGYYTKKEIRHIAEELELSIADKPDSQEICFVSTNYREFISEKAPNKIEEGPFVDIKGNVIGKHKGIPFYTIGQRRGLGISAGKPLYVINIDVKNNAVVLGRKTSLRERVFSLSDELGGYRSFEQKMQVKAKIRYNFNEKPAEITPVDDDTVKVVFNEPQKAVTPGQAVVFYNDDIVVGGGIIKQRCDLE